MKLLIDNNLSYKLVSGLELYFPESDHVRSTVGILADDLAVWEYALKNSFVILTKDNDFDERSLVNGCPPKVIHLLCGNRSTDYILDLILKNHSELIAFGVNDKENCILKVT